MKQARRPGNRVVVASCLAFVAAMVGAAYAAVPLYDLFCRVTGFAGTPSVSAAAPVEAIDREMVVRFDANVAGGLPWRFAPSVRSVRLKVGEVAEATYVIENPADAETWGTATFNVTPYVSGGYFAKIQCFCFTAQRLGPGERREVPVVFYVDPAIADDRSADSLTTITLSYTFFPAERPAGAADPALANGREFSDTSGEPPASGEAAARGRRI